MSDHAILVSPRRGDADLHFWLTRSVGRCMGLSFRAAMDAGRLSPDHFRDLIRTCQTCPHVSSCQHWLGNQRRDVANVQAPGFCPNRIELNALKRH